jgi:hypothetical protein
VQIRWRILAESKQKVVDSSLRSEESTQEEQIALSTPDTLLFIDDLIRLVDTIFDQAQYLIRVEKDCDITTIEAERMILDM